MFACVMPKAGLRTPGARRRNRLGGDRSSRSNGLDCGVHGRLFLCKRGISVQQRGGVVCTAFCTESCWTQPILMRYGQSGLQPNNPRLTKQLDGLPIRSAGKPSSAARLSKTFGQKGRCERPPKPLTCNENHSSPCLGNGAVGVGKRIEQRRGRGPGTHQTRKNSACVAQRCAGCGRTKPVPLPAVSRPEWRAAQACWLCPGAGCFRGGAVAVCESFEFLPATIEPMVQLLENGKQRGTCLGFLLR